MSQRRDSENEMSMDEILASIRHYVSDPQDGNRGARPDTRAEIRSEMDVSPPEVIRLTEAFDTRSTYESPSTKDDFLDPQTVRASSQAFQKLTDSLRTAKIHEPSQPYPSSYPSQTLEQFLAEIIRPLAKQWLDQHLPKIVERVVELEVEKIIRKQGHTL